MSKIKRYYQQEMERERYWATLRLLQSINQLSGTIDKALEALEKKNQNDKSN